MSDGEQKERVSFTFNGRVRDAWVSAHETVLDVLREEYGTADIRYGCGEGVCGTCTVLLDGEPVSGCLLLAVQVDGRDLRGVRGLADLDRIDGHELHPLQEAFLRHGAAQCGFCTPGMILTAYALVRRGGRPSRDEIRYELAGNLCRCTGYTKILDAVEEYASDAREPEPRATRARHRRGTWQVRTCRAGGEASEAEPRGTRHERG